MPRATHNTALIVPLTQPSVEAMATAMAQVAAAGADMVELRLDYLERVDAAGLERLLRHRPATPSGPLRVIATYRPVRQGGRCAGDEAHRLALLGEAARAGAEFVDVELDADAGQRTGLLAACRRHGARGIVSHHDFERRPADLEAIAAAIAATGADVVKIAFTAAGPEDAIAALDIVRRATRPAIVLAMGEAGLASRLLAAKVGAFGTFAALEVGAESAPGQPTLDELRNLYRWDAIGPATAVYGVVGCPVAHSMSPAIHNAAFAQAGVDAVYVPLRVAAAPGCFDRFMDAAMGAPWADFRGLSVTIPHKEAALARVGAANLDELSRRIGAVNTVRIDPAGGGARATLRGWNTDYAGAIDALCGGMGIARAGLAGRTVAVLGAGGAARALVAALAYYRAQVTVYNRTLARAERLAEEFGAAAAALEGLDRLRPTAPLGAEIVINCTSLGMHPNVEDTPLPRAALPSVRVVFDTIYNPIETRLLREARAAGCVTISGVEMFVNQAAAQFELWTNRPAPRELMRGVVIQRLQPLKK